MARSRAAANVLLGVVLAANVLFAVSRVPPHVLLGTEPVAQLDYAMHFSRAVAANEFLTHFGRTWGYDPYFALVPWRTGLEVIGGPYPLVWLQHNFANFAAVHDMGMPDEVRLFGRPIAEFEPAQLRTYLDAYNVGTVVAYTDDAVSVFTRAPWLRPAAQVGRYRIYENADRTTPFLKGTGSVRVEYGAIRLTDASRGELVLKYHWAPFLASDPPQEILPHSVLDDPVPFIRLPANTFADFVITRRRSVGGTCSSWARATRRRR